MPDRARCQWMLSRACLSPSIRVIADQKPRLLIICNCCDDMRRREYDCMRFIRNLLAGLLLTGVLTLAPANSFARGGGGGGGHFGGGGGGHFGGGSHVGGFHGGFARGGIGAVAHGFHGAIAQ